MSRGNHRSRTNILQVLRQGRGHDAMIVIGQCDVLVADGVDDDEFVMWELHSAGNGIGRGVRGFAIEETEDVEYGMAVDSRRRNKW